MGEIADDYIDKPFCGERTDCLNAETYEMIGPTMYGR